MAKLQVQKPPNVEAAIQLPESCLCVPVGIRPV